MVIRILNVPIALLLFAPLVLSSNQPGPQKQRPAIDGIWKRIQPIRKSSDGLVLTISVNDPEIKIVCKRIVNGEEKTRELVYHTDSRTETARTFLGNSEGQSKTSWHGSKLLSSFLINSKDVRAGTATVTQEWKLSADGKTLIETETFRQTEIPVTMMGGTSREVELATEQARILNPLLPTTEVMAVFERVANLSSSH